MERREAIKYAAFFCASVLTVTGAGLVPVACVSSHDEDEIELNVDDEKFISEIAATLIPESDVPGAAALNLGPFVAMMLQDCYLPEERAAFKKGLRSLNERSNVQFKQFFADLKSEEREELLKSYGKDEPKFMQLLTRLVNTGYYTSEIGSKQALRYVFVPGGYKSCVPLEPGQKAWAM